MKRRSRILLAALLVVVLGGLVWAVMPSGPPDPVYDGHPVSWWLENPTPGKIIIQLDDSSQLTLPGFPRMDSNAVPYLIKSLETPGGPLHGAREYVWNRLPLNLRIHLPGPIDASDIRISAAAALYTLGSDAKPAIPALIRVFEGDEIVFTQATAAQALGIVGPEDMRVKKALIDALNSDRNKSSFARYQAAVVLGTISKNDKTVKEALVEAQKDPDLSVRIAATNALSQIGPEAADKTGVK